MAAVEILRSEQRAKNFGYRNRRILRLEEGFLVLFLGGLLRRFFPTNFPMVFDFPGTLTETLEPAWRLRQSWEDWQRCFGDFVGDSSVRAKQRTRFLIARLGVSNFDSGSHNPEGFEGALPVAEEATEEAGQALGFAQTKCRAKP